jgi:predicted transcriptional regulator
MRINEIMSRDVETARPQDTIQDVARKMREIDSGAIPVCDGDKVQGVITDRDIVIRAVSEARRGHDWPCCLDGTDICDSIDLPSSAESASVPSEQGSVERCFGLAGLRSRRDSVAFPR